MFQTERLYQRLREANIKVPSDDETAYFDDQEERCAKRVGDKPASKGRKRAKDKDGRRRKRSGAGGKGVQKKRAKEGTSTFQPPHLALLPQGSHPLPQAPHQLVPPPLLAQHQHLLAHDTSDSRTGRVSIYAPVPPPVIRSAGPQPQAVIPLFAAVGAHAVEATAHSGRGVRARNDTTNPAALPPPPPHLSARPQLFGSLHARGRRRSPLVPQIAPTAQPPYHTVQHPHTIPQPPTHAVVSTHDAALPTSVLRKPQQMPSSILRQSLAPQELGRPLGAVASDTANASGAGRRRKRTAMSDEHEAALDRWVRLQARGASDGEIAAAKMECERALTRAKQQQPPAAAVASGDGQQSLPGLWYREEADAREAAERLEAASKRRKMSALRFPWMHDSDVGVHSDSTDGYNSALPLRPAAAAGMAATATAGGVPPGGAAGANLAYHRVRVLLPEEHEAERSGSPQLGSMDMSSDEDEADGTAEDGRSISFRAFSRRWLSQSRFAFSLHAEDCSASTGAKAPTVVRPPYRNWRLIGIAVCWQPCAIDGTCHGCSCATVGEPPSVPAVYYLPLVTDSMGENGVYGRQYPSDTTRRSKHHSAWRLVQSVFDQAASVKVSDQAKMQSALLLERGVRIAGRLHDPRTAAWMLCTREGTDNCSTRSLAEQYFPELEATLEATLRAQAARAAAAGAPHGSSISKRDVCCRNVFRCLSLMGKLEALLAQQVCTAAYRGCYTLSRSPPPPLLSPRLPH